MFHSFHKFSVNQQITFLLAITVLIASLTSRAAQPPRTADDATESAFLADYNISYLTMEDGLSHNFIDDILRDSRGFMWFALGGGGLTRYDGCEFLNFSPSSEARPLKGSFVIKLAEDNFRRLWVATEGGFNIIDLNFLSEVEVVDHTGLLNALESSPMNFPAWSVMNDSEGKIWMHSNSDIICLEFNEKGDVVNSGRIKAPDATRYIVNITDVCSDGQPWAMLNGHLSRLSLNDNGEISVSKIDSCLDQLDDAYITGIAKKGEEIWIASDHGLWRYNNNEKMAKAYVHLSGDHASISQNFVSDVEVLKNGRLVVATLRGLSVYNPIKDNFEHIYDFGPMSKKRGLNNNYVNTLLSDDDCLWVGTEGGGVNYFAPKRLFVRTVRNNCDTRGNYIDNPVNALYTDPEGRVWVGTVEGGLHRTDGDVLSFDHFTVENGALTHNSVSTLCSDNQGALWVGSWGGGINLLDINNPSKRLRTYETTSDGLHRLTYIGVLIHDASAGKMWIGTSTGLFVCDLKTGVLSEAYPGSARCIPGAIGAVFDSERNLWFGSSRGLVCVDLKSYYSGQGEKAFRFIRHRLNDPNSVADERITSLFIDSSGEFWIGTNGSGVYRRSVEEGVEVFTNLSTADGLPNDIIHGFVEDHEGRLWISTYKGLVCRFPDGRLISYDTEDGIDSDRFYWNAAGLAKSGRVLFGSSVGLVVVDADNSDFVSAGKYKNVEFTRFYIDNRDIPFFDERLEKNGDAISGLRFHESDKSFSVEFSAFDFERIGGKYVCRLRGFDNDWITLPNGRNSVIYTSLPPGDYSLEVYYQSVSGGRQEVSVLPVTVEPYFYKRWWFILLAVIAVAAGIIALHYNRLYNLNQQKLQLEKAVGERAAEVEAKNRQLQQLILDRITFFTNITHEFRTPITLILGPVERALKLSFNPQVIEQLRLVQRNSKYLLSLVNQLMDFRKVEAGKMEIVRSSGNFLNFIREMVDSFRPMAEDRDIKLRLVAHMPNPQICYDEEALRKVIINLLGNAVKFSPDGGSVTVFVALMKPTAGCRLSAPADAAERPAGPAGPRDAQPDDNVLYISISDTGNGIPEEELPHVFERFYQGKSQLKYPVVGTSGSGIGLYLCKGIVEIYGGSISVKNNPNGVGCVFRVLLPVSAAEVQPEASSTAKTGPVQPVTDDESMRVSDSPDEKPRVLVVEDNPDMRQFIRTILRDQYSVYEAANGEEALQLLHSTDIDLIISDLMMPVMDGLELSKRVKENFSVSHIPFLMLTAKTARESRLEGYRIGVDEYILKPFDEELLLARIKNILENKRRYQRAFNADMKVDKLNIEEDSRDKKFMDSVMSVIKDNYKNSYFEIGDFAEALGISRSLLNKKLQSLVGQSAGQLLRDYRMNVARDMLERNRKTRAMNISEIAYEVGFNDAKYFTRCFSKHFNVPPSAVLNNQ